MIALPHRRITKIHHGPRGDARIAVHQCCSERGAVVGHGRHKPAAESGDGGLEAGREDGRRS